MKETPAAGGGGGGGGGGIGTGMEIEISQTHSHSQPSAASINHPYPSPSPSPSPSSSSSTSSINPNIINNTTNVIIPSPSPTTSTINNNNHHHNPHPNPNSMHSWWESIARARSSIHSLSTILSSSCLDPSPSSVSLVFSAISDSDRPARALLDSPEASLAVSSALSHPLSGSGSDPLCHWLYDTLLSPDPDLRLVPISFLPLLSGLYLSRLASSPDASLPGFEAVLLSLYSSVSKSRAGKPLLVSIPDLSLPSLYHSPRSPSPNSPSPPSPVALLSPPLEPLSAVKSTKRASIVAVSLDAFFSHISLMPPRSKLDLCRFASSWASQDCPCLQNLDLDIITTFSSPSDDDLHHITNHVEEEMGRLEISAPNETPKSPNGACRHPELPKGARVPLPWELFQPILRIIGHCLLAPLNPPEVRDAASEAARRLYARAVHDLLPQAILATRSLIRLDRRARVAARTAASAATSHANTPTKPKKPEILLVSK